MPMPATVVDVLEHAMRLMEDETWNFSGPDTIACIPDMSTGVAMGAMKAYEKAFAVAALADEHSMRWLRLAAFKAAIEDEKKRAGTPQESEQRAER